nr:MAG TPA: hypothetical protein [Caudoviricetes sp.]
MSCLKNQSQKTKEYRQILLTDHTFSNSHTTIPVLKYAESFKFEQ